MTGEAWGDMMDDVAEARVEAGDGLPGYDEWRLATPPEYEFLGAPPTRERRRPLEPGMCGQRRFACYPWLCTKRAGHDDDCNTFGESP